MQVDWVLIGKALCLVAVIEGLGLALMPGRVRDAAMMVVRMPDRSLRNIGLGSMVAGALLLLALN